MVVCAMSEGIACHASRGSSARTCARRAGTSHQIGIHPLIPDLEVNLAGQDGNDAKSYQERDVREAVRRADEVSLPEWGDLVHTHGDTYEESLEHGRELIELLIQSRSDRGEALPEPHVFA